MSKFVISTFNTLDSGGGDKALTLSDYVSKNLYKIEKEFNFLNQHSETEIEDIINNIVSYDKKFYNLLLMYKRKKNNYENNVRLPIITNNTTNFNRLILPNLKVILNSPQTMDERLEGLNELDESDIILSLNTKINNLINGNINTTIIDKINSIVSECNFQITSNSVYKVYCENLLSDITDIKNNIES